MEEFSYDDISTVITISVVAVVMTIIFTSISILIANDFGLMCVEYGSRDVYVKHRNRYYQEKEDVCIRYERIKKESD